MWTQALLSPAAAANTREGSADANPRATSRHAPRPPEFVTESAPLPAAADVGAAAQPGAGIPLPRGAGSWSGADRDGDMLESNLRQLPK